MTPINLSAHNSCSKLPTPYLQIVLTCEINVMGLFHNKIEHFLKFWSPPSAWFHMLTCCCQIQLLAHQKEFISVDSSGSSLGDTITCHLNEAAELAADGAKAKETILSPEAISSLLGYPALSFAALQSGTPQERIILALAPWASQNPKALPNSICSGSFHFLPLLQQSGKTVRRLPTILRSIEHGGALPAKSMSISLADLWWTEDLRGHWWQMGPAEGGISFLWLLTLDEKEIIRKESGRPKWGSAGEKGGLSPTPLLSPTRELWGRLIARDQERVPGLKRPLDNSPHKEAAHAESWLISSHPSLPTAKPGPYASLMAQKPHL